MNREFTISDKLYQFIKEQVNDYYTLELIAFFANHPYARFSELAIIHALNRGSEKRQLQKALGNLVDNGIMKTYPDNNVTLYSLSEDALVQKLMLELIKLDVRQRQLLQREVSTHMAVVTAN